jgi:hypothetical protein
MPTAKEYAMKKDFFMPERGRLTRFTPFLFAAALVAAVPLPAAAVQRAHPSPEVLAAVFADAIEKDDEARLRDLFGEDFRTLIPPAGEEIRQRFLSAWSRSHRVVADGEARALVEVGDDGWTLPVPLVKGAEGWRFDTLAGVREIRARAIGRNELSAIQVALAYCDAQQEYAEVDPDGNGVADYARRLLSSAGKRDGLYWPTPEGEPPSPFGPLVAQAYAEGAREGEGYHGYRYRILTAQGKDAPGGATDYIVGGRMIGGYALVAWPVRYGETGIMSFIVNHDGVVYQADLGPATAKRAMQMSRFDPGPGWSRAEQH